MPACQLQHNRNSFVVPSPDAIRAGIGATDERVRFLRRLLRLKSPTGESGRPTAAAVQETSHAG